MFERLPRRFGEGLVGRIFLGCSGMQLGANGSRWAGKGNGRRRTTALKIMSIHCD